MFRRPQPENFVNYQLQASLGRQPRSATGRIPIKRRKRTKIKKEKRNDSFLLRQQDVDKRRAVYRPDRLLALHQSALTNATRTSTEIGRGLTATGTTLGLERQQVKDASIEKAKGRVLLALANRLESKEPLINVGVGYTQHRLPEDLNSIRLPDREQTIKELGYREPRAGPDPQVQELGYKEPRQQPHTSHRKPSDDNSNLEPLLQSFDVEPAPFGVEDVTDQTPIPRVEKPSVGKLDPSRTQALEGLSFQVASADDPRVKQATLFAQTQRNIERQSGTNEPEPQVRRPAPEPKPQQSPLPSPRPESPEPEPEKPTSIYEQWKQVGTRVGGTGEFAPPEVEQQSIKTSLSKPPVREKEKAPPNEQQQRQIDAVEEARRRRQEKIKEKFGKLKEDIVAPEGAEEGDPEVFPLRRETESIEDLRKEARRIVADEDVFKKPEPRSRDSSRASSRELTPSTSLVSQSSGRSQAPTPPTSGRTTPVRQQSGRRNIVVPPVVPLQQNFVTEAPEGRGQVEEVEEEETWLDSLPDKSSFHSGLATNELTGSTYSFVDTDGIISSGKFKGKELAILGVNKKGNVLLQLKDTIGTGKVDASVRANISFKRFKANLEDLNLKPLNP